MNALSIYIPDNSYATQLVNSIDTKTFNSKSFCFSPKDIAGLVQAAENTSAKDNLLDASILNTNVSEAHIDVPPIIYTRRENLKGKPFVSLQKWEGVVTEVGRESFSAKLLDLNYSVDEVAEISLDEVLPDDIDLVKPGAVFYWSIGYSDPSGVRVRSSIILFRRLPRASERQLRAADARAIQVRKQLGLD